MRSFLKYCIFMTLLLLIIGCDEDPITPPLAGDYDFDSARFNWSVDTVNDWGFDLFSVYSPDTSEIFAANNNGDYLLHIHNGIQTRYYFSDFSPHYVGGTSSNEVYIGGGKFNGSIYLPHLKKWTGGGFIDIDIPTKYPFEEVIGNGIINSGSDMWFCTQLKLIKYDGSQFTEYIFTDTSRIPFGFFLKNGTVPTIVSNYLEPNTDTVLGNSIYELQGDTVIEIFQKSWYQNPIEYIPLRVMKENIYGTRYDHVYNFVLPDLIPSVTPPEGYFFASGITGNSINDFIIIMNGGDPPTPFGPFVWFYHWDGIKFSKEKAEIPSSVYLSFLQDLYRMNDDYFIALFQRESGTHNSYFYKATRKK
jgi:hypothetical protein